MNTKVFYMNTKVYLWYLAEFLLEFELFRTEFLERIRAHILCSVALF